MTDARETHTPGAPEPELPPKVPESENALTPDLPPLDPPAPDLRVVKEPKGGKGDEDEPRIGHDHPAEDPAPQEPTA
ncbi:hypothetical protein EDE04_0309 [Streptomyces sp. 2132.2]|uniref:hypothetical protein n=1 Tax=Streptomyces sp. 2132.2 TaxID=2485161 RepID=UPI000F4867F6|nr:hypothetical protein [Streptomyces sp. 2132.2]ROQ93902.1 hypothetical protein EDE04_0309 [Streptomyces sp. 2132.2]